MAVFVCYAPYCPDLVADQMAVLCIIRIVLYFVLYLYYVLSYPAGDTWVRLGARSEEEAYGCHVQRFRRDVGIAVAREFARYRLLRVPFIGVPRALAVGTT